MNDIIFFRLYIFTKTILKDKYELSIIKGEYVLHSKLKLVFTTKDIYRLESFFIHHINLYDEIKARQLLRKAFDLFLSYENLRIYEKDGYFYIASIDTRKPLWIYRTFTSFFKLEEYLILKTDFSIEIINELICPKCGNLYYEIKSNNNATIFTCYCGKTTIDVL